MSALRETAELIEENRNCRTVEMGASPVPTGVGDLFQHELRPLLGKLLEKLDRLEECVGRKRLPRILRDGLRDLLRQAPDFGLQPAVLRGRAGG